ncbi:MAG: hypothetical protein WCC64_16170, partial [Aliidongia sp.]
ADANSPLDCCMIGPVHAGFILIERAIIQSHRVAGFSLFWKSENFWSYQRTSVTFPMLDLMASGAEWRGHTCNV